MSMGIVRCGRCHTILPAGTWNTRQFHACTCGAQVMVEVFPAILKAFLDGQGGERIAGPTIEAGAVALPTMVHDDQQAGCFYHPTKKAVVPCDHCGRFLCGLCDIEFHAMHLCPKCLQIGQVRRKASTGVSAGSSPGADGPSQGGMEGFSQDLVTYRLLHDRVAFDLAVLAVPIPPAALAALYVAIRYWNAPGSIVGRSHARGMLAIGLSLASLVLWSGLLLWLHAGGRL